MDYDFARLTQAQQSLLSFQGWTASEASHRPQPQPRTVAKLIERGLVIQHEVDYGRMIVMEYEVPIPVHIAWCAQCSATAHTALDAASPKRGWGAAEAGR